VPDQDATLRDSSHQSFTGSRGLFQQTLNNHQHVMASRHQMALNEIDTAVNLAVENTRDGATAPDKHAGKIPSSSVVERNTAGSESTRPGNGAAPAGGGCGSTVHDECHGTASVVPNTAGMSASQHSAGGVVQESTMSCDSLTATDGPHEADLASTHRVTSPSTAVHSSPTTSGSSVMSAVERSARDPVRTDVNGNVAAPGIGVVRLASHLWEGLRPTTDHGATDADDVHSRGRADWVMTNLPGVESDAQHGGQTGSIKDGTSVVTGSTVTVSGHVQSGGCGVMGDAAAEDRAGAGSSSSFFLHRNSPSPNVAIVQPSVHPPATTTDQCPAVCDVQPSSTTSGSLQEQSVPSCQPNTYVMDQCTDKDGVHPSSNISSGLLSCLPQQRSIPGCAADGTHPVDTPGVHRQPVLGFVSTPSMTIHTPCLPNTMTVLPLEKQHALSQPQPPETYRKPSPGQVATGSSTIFAIPPCYMPASQSEMTEFSNHKTSVLGFPNDKSPTLDFQSVTCIKDNITYEEIPVDDTSSVSSITSDIGAAATSAHPGLTAAAHELKIMSK